MFIVVLVEYWVGYEFRFMCYWYGCVYRWCNLCDGGCGSVISEYFEESVDVGDFCGFVKR